MFFVHRIIYSHQHRSSWHDFKLLFNRCNTKSMKHFLTVKNTARCLPLIFSDFSEPPSSPWQTVMYFCYVIKLTATGNMLGRFKTSASDPPMQFIFGSLIGLSETALRACVTVLAWEEKPCYQLSLGCYLQNSTEPVNKQEERQLGRSVCIRARTHVRPHSEPSKQTTVTSAHTTW